jgi:hypothetical protein
VGEENIGGNNLLYFLLPHFLPGANCKSIYGALKIIAEIGVAFGVR